MSESAAIIVGFFFVIGITVGIILVLALAAVRADSRGQRGGPPAPSGHRPGRSGAEPPDTGWDTGPDDSPRWPGDDDGDFSRGMAARRNG